MKNLAIIPARSGSKGLKDKNIKKLGEKPLIAYTIEAARESGMFECVHVSTDSEMYADISRKFGADVPFLREALLASDIASTWDAVRYVIGEYQKRGRMFDTICLLQPTSPLREAEDIVHAYHVFGEKSAECVMSVCEMDHPPQWSNVLPADNCMKNFIAPEFDVRRQELSVYYRQNGAIYILDTNILKSNLQLYGEKSYAYVMSREKSIDIDDAVDFVIAEELMHMRENRGL